MDFCDPILCSQIFTGCVAEYISRGEAADLYCAECDSSHCQKCDQLWHSHRLRRHHVLSVSLQCQLSILSDTAVNRDSKKKAYYISSCYIIPAKFCSIYP